MRDISLETIELHCAKTHVEILVAGNRMLIFQCSGEDVVDKLVAQLQELGLKLEEEFNSPCG